MIMRHIDRSRSTGGSMGISIGVHAGLLFLLAALIGGQAAMVNQQDDLTEIAYIEARYGEDVAAKVKLKDPPRRKPEPVGRGVNTDSAMKPAAESSTAPPRPEPKAIDEPQLAQAPQPAPVPKLQSKPKPRPKMVTPAASTPKPRPAAAKIEVNVPQATQTQAQVLAQADQLKAKAPKPKARTVVNASQLAGTMVNRQVDDVKAPNSVKSADRAAFTPASGGLKSRSGSVATADDVVVASSGGTTTSIAEAPTAVTGGGGLKSSGRSSYQAPQAALAPASGAAKKSGSGVVDVDGPTGDGGGTKSGRKTILNYGSGGGGRGGGLATRQRIAEPSVNEEIVAQPKNSAQPSQKVAEVKLDGKGVNMTISGQIKGRKILSSVAPQYTALARKKGWEGVVAVHFTVLADGRVKDNMYFDQTSVHRDLNKAAMAAIKQFRFAPLGSNQAAVEQWGVITIVFRLN